MTVNISQFLPLNEVMGILTSTSRDLSSYFLLLHLHYPVTCYEVHGRRVVGYEDLQSLDLRKDTTFVGAEM